MAVHSLDAESRLNALNDYQVFGTPPEKEFDRIVNMMSVTFSVPTALIGFMNNDSHYFKARLGFDACEASREVSFCTYTVERGRLLVIPDTKADPAYRDSPLVKEAPGIRFYAGAPIRTPSGHCLGAISLVGYVPRDPLTEAQEAMLEGFAEMVMDHLARRRLLLVRRAALKLASSIPDAIICINQADEVTFWNRGAERLTGLHAHKARGRKLGEVLGAQFQHLMFDAGGGNRDWRSVENRRSFVPRADGTHLPVEVSSAVWVEDNQYQRGFVIRDIAHRQDLQNRVRLMRDTDRMTGLANRERFLEMTQGYMDRGRPVTVIKVGLDNFKTVNSSLGMVTGDEVLREAARRVSGLAPEASLVARLAGDEFGMLLYGGQDEEAIRALGEVVIREVSRAYRIHGFECRITACVGIASAPAEAGVELDSSGVLKRALLALQEAKCLGSKQVVVFTSELSERVEKKHRLEQDLRVAFKRRDFELHFQPQNTLATGKVVGAEALLRWRHPARGLVFPGDFIGVLEVSDQALRVGDWILEASCAFAAGQLAKYDTFRVGVNLFACQLRDTALADKVEALLKRYNLPPQSLELEITENTILGMSPEILGVLQRLHDHGVGLAFDDYGTGYASLSLLKQYPLTRLKIDRQFISNLITSLDDLAIVNSIIVLGRNLGLEVIAEGIEEQEQMDMLQRLGCHEGQGYWFSRPVPEARFPGGN
ncbi:putative bifunctional diguanylate cyclase/phosphodiesterase [Alloalcanivorax marinus]|uniref:putative bifunctional diguanylate cyclase/phosphodiesterase n=1 Tax=Alloalcanivorax marinus TaxID=1177169 RepID=UPI0021D06B59|nr:EAL domain-containing protein [Alloalcanivorax marinus]